MGSPPAHSPSMFQAGKQQSKAAAKNAKRKEKRAEEPPAPRKPEPGPAPAAGVEGVRQTLAGVRLEAQTTAAAPTPASRIRALKKKLRQAEELAAAQASGKQLQEEQLHKLERIPEL